MRGAQRRFEPPPYPYDRLEELKAVAGRLEGGLVDLSVGTPCDPPSPAVVGALAASGAERAYPASAGSPAYRSAAAGWLRRRLGAAAGWGRARGVPVLSDECYVELTWDGPPRTILEHGPTGVLALHSLSKRSNLAGARAGFYAGDAGLVGYLSEVRRHAGFMVPGPVQAAAVAAWGDDAHAEAQRARYRRRLDIAIEVAALAGAPARMPAGAFYLWLAAPGGDAWALARSLAERGGALVSPGDLYGPLGAGHVRLAAVQPEDRLRLVAQRLAANR